MITTGKSAPRHIVRSMNRVVVTPIIRGWSALLAVFSLICVYAFVVTPKIYETKAYETVTDITSIRGWSLVWTLVAAFSLYTAVTRRMWGWVMASRTALCAAGIWWLGLTYEAWFHHTTISWTGWGLWLWFVVTTFLTMLSPCQFEMKDPTHGPVNLS